ncbi:MAG: hypothetical protein WDN28_18510 [Chthoniobacter sp.]
MKTLPFLSATLVACLLAACATAPDTSHYVSLGSHRGYYILEPGSPLQEKLGYGRAPVSDTADPLHRGYGNDVIAFRFDRAGVLSAPPAYIAQLKPDRENTSRLARLVQGVSTRDQIERLFPPGNQRLIQPDGGLLVYHDVAVYNALEQLTQPGGSN